MALSFKASKKLSLLITLFLFSLPLFTQNVFAKKADSDKQIIRLATTTSTENSGLLKYLLPEFEKESGYKVHVIAVGTGKALRMGRDGDVDVLLVHALNAEKKFVADGYGEKRFSVMYNDFVIVGPKDGSKAISNADTINKTLTAIASSGERFISRGDDSGTHKKELSLWKTTSSVPDAKKDKWYLEAGQGMGKVLQMAGEMNAYTMADRGTWLAFESKSPLKIVFEGDSKLFNPYGIIAINHDKYPNTNLAGANALIQWITSKKGQLLIGQFKIAGKTLFTPSAASVASLKATTK